jgi:hypothetical protein
MQGIEASATMTKTDMLHYHHAYHAAHHYASSNYS